MFRIGNDFRDDAVAANHPMPAVARCPENIWRLAKDLGVGALHILTDPMIAINVEVEHAIRRDMRWNGALCVHGRPHEMSSAGIDFCVSEGGLPRRYATTFIDLAVRRASRGSRRIAARIL